MPLARQTIPVGIVVRRTPGVTRWAKWVWQVIAVLPGAGPAQWREMRREGDTIEYHAATLPLDLWSSDTEAYKVTISAKVPGLVVVMREVMRETEDETAAVPFVPTFVTASAYDGQDYMDSGDGLIELVPMPVGLIAVIQAFCDQHHVEEVFVKRKRDRKDIDAKDDGKGDARIRQLSDVYRTPRSIDVVQ